MPPSAGNKLRTTDVQATVTNNTYPATDITGNIGAMKFAVGSSVTTPNGSGVFTITVSSMTTVGALFIIGGDSANISNAVHELTSVSGNVVTCKSWHADSAAVNSSVTRFNWLAFGQ